MNAGPTRTRRPAAGHAWTRIGRTAAATLVVVVLAGLVAACGVSSQRTATRIEPESVPFGLLDDDTTSTAVEAGRTTSVYLLSGDRLVAVDRSVPEDASLADLLKLVVGGPTEVEQSLGITTSVPSGTLASVETSRGIAEVDLASSFGDIRSGEQILALGQIVYTLTGQPGIGGVRFTVEGKEVTVPLSDGTPSDDPLSRDDFKAIAPE